MRIFRTFYMVAAMLLTTVAVGFSSCSDDDDDDNGVFSTSELVGTWEGVCSHYIYWEDGEKVCEDEYEDDSDIRIKFNADGTCLYAEYYNGKWNWEEEGSWSYSGSVITIINEDGDVNTSGKVKTLTSSKLIVEGTIEYTEEGVKCKEYFYEEYRKVND